MVDKKVIPYGFGSGCIAKYKDRYFFLTVAHVTDFDLATCIETNQPSEGTQSKLYSLGAMCFFDLYGMPANAAVNIQSTDDLFKNFKERLDISFCEIKEKVELLQPEWDFGAYKIHAGEKVCLNLDLAGKPEKGKKYGFCGRVRQDLKDNTLESKPIIKFDIDYLSDKGNLHRFVLPELISDAEDYKGSSGAPILDEEGKLVALAAKVWEGTKMLYGFSIDECKKLLDYALATGML
jgi:hypothetical protein